MTTTKTKTNARKKATAKQAKPKQATAAKNGRKLSQMAAAEKVLAGAKESMTCRAMVEAMAKRKLWSSPGGKTPEATLYSAILRDLKKGKDARFKKVAPGQFALNAK